MQIRENTKDYIVWLEQRGLTLVTKDLVKGEDCKFERMAKYGSVVPDVWMTHATGAAVSAAPLLRAAEEALKGMP